MTWAPFGLKQPCFCRMFFDLFFHWMPLAPDFLVGMVPLREQEAMEYIYKCCALFSLNVGVGVVITQSNV